MLSTFQAEADPEYAKVVSRGVVDAVKHAWEKRSPCKVGSGAGKVAGIHFNRRFLMRDGREVTHPGKMHPEIVRPAGPVDPKVGVLAVADAEGKVMGVVVNFGCHCTVTEEGTEYSADYVHYLREHLRRLLGDMAVVFLQGACGDVTQIDNQSRGWEKGHSWADMMGATLAGETARVVNRVQWEGEPVIRVAGERVSIGIREGDGCEKPRLGLGSGEFWEEMYEKEKPHVARMRQETPVVDCEICGIRTGELAMVSNGGELFCAPSLEIQESSGFHKTWVVTLANEYLGYIPTAKAFYAGGYEVRTARSSFLDVTAAQRIVEGSLRVLKKLAL